MCGLYRFGFNWRWEGGINDGKPFGWGILYNEDGLKEYEGFLLDTSRICYGKEYYPDICQIRYDGCYMNNQRFDEGILYDRKGGIEYDGLWKNDEPYLPRIDGRLLTNRTEFFLSLPLDSIMCSRYFSLSGFTNYAGL